MVEHEYKNYSWSVIVHSKQLDSKKRSDRHKSSERSHNLILNFYRRFFSSDILLWSSDEEYEIMKKEMKKMLERKVLSCNKKEIIPADEMEFRKVLSKTNIHTDFARLLDEYYRNDIKEYIFDRIQQKMKKLREYLDFNEEENE